MSLEDRLRRCLAELYGRPAAESTWNRLARLLEQSRGSQSDAAAHVGPLTEKDAILITYGDQFRRTGQPPLQTLAEFVETWLGDLLNGIHILPFYPYSSDDGFSVIDYRQVDPDLGDWGDIERLGRKHRLMVDGVLNHISQHSAWFQGFLLHEPPYTQYFITPQADWDLDQVVRPRTLPLLTEFETAAGPRRVWTTFSADQIDLNYANPDVLLEIIAVLLFYVERGASIIRLDAIAYLWKEPGTTCIHLENTHRVIKILRLVLDLVAPQVLLISETNVPHAENIRYFGQVDPLTGRSDEAQLVYQFPLAPLILHSFTAEDATRLSRWANSLGEAGLFFNFTASHDGIGVLPARGLLSPAEEASLVERTLAHGGRVSYKSNPDGTQSPYELNITFYDALNDPATPDPPADLARFMASQTIMLSLAGVPGVYVHSLFGSRNCQPCLDETGRARSINREKFDYAALQAELEQGESQRARVFAAYRRLFELRCRQPAFHPHARQQVLDISPAVFALLRVSPDGSRPLVSLVNVSGQRQAVHIDLAALNLPENRVWSDCIRVQEWQPEDGRLEVQLAPWQAMWLAPTANPKGL